MKKLLTKLTMVMLAFGLVSPAIVHAYNFGDFRSETLTAKAWQAFQQDDIEAVLAFTNKCLELYAEPAKKMQDSLKAFPEGSNDDVFAFWALNDVATSLFIQGEAYRKAGMNDEAIAVYKKLADDYTYGQAWDPKGWFWKPSEAGKEKLAMLESGTNLDFGDYTSSYLTTQAWKALGENDVDAVIAYTDKVVELYSDKASEMQKGLTEFPWDTDAEANKKKIFSFWALNDVGTSLFIRGEALKKAGKKKEAIKVYTQLMESYSYSQCWDPNGWFWKPKEAAEQSLAELGA